MYMYIEIATMVATGMQNLNLETKKRFRQIEKVLSKVQGGIGSTFRHHPSLAHHPTLATADSPQLHRKSAKKIVNSVTV